MTDEPGESDLRRRAAWLLAMLAVVAALLVLLLVLLSGHGSSGGTPQNNAGPDDSLGPTSAAPASHRAASSASAAPSSSHPTHASCPTSSPCALSYDIGNAVAAINRYRTQNNLQAVPGSVSSAAKQCALGDGSNCSGGWAESQVAKPTGTAALDKIKQRGNLLDPSMTSFGVGWAYDPQAKQYYFAIIHHD